MFTQEQKVTQRTKSTLLIEGEAELTYYEHAFDMLRSAALSPDDSLAFRQQTIDSIAQEEELNE
ncbi:Scr1 family TA system antitoxin-like transcriptional regulator [Streptomyces sp. SID12501]|uniref:DUF5753 domain-containing protein n=1 Tax=Streptomyces sp. SID12501 TaxID=2706042 RepID=A0A6B3BTK8_9ACTN|nr:hypothetical protein [Streptomyces sp. SID12501]